MKRIPQKTLFIITKILEKRIFSQKSIWRECNRSIKVSFGQVNNVFHELIENDFVKERSKLEIKYGINRYDNIKIENEYKEPKYYLNDPAGLLNYISLFRSMKDLKIFELSLDASTDTILNEMKKMDMILCLGSALERYSSYYRPDEISVYSYDPERIFDHARTARQGKTRITCYEIDFIDEIDEEVLNENFNKNKEGIYFTSKVQTVIDMFCDNKGAYTKPILEKYWGVKI